MRTLLLSFGSMIIVTPACLGMDMKIGIDEGLIPSGGAKIQISSNCAATCCTIVSPIC